MPVKLRLTRAAPQSRIKLGPQMKKSDFRRFGQKLPSIKPSLHKLAQKELSFSSLFHKTGLTQCCRKFRPLVILVKTSAPKKSLHFRKWLSAIPSFSKFDPMIVAWRRASLQFSSNFPMSPLKSKPARSAEYSMP